jgi:hypothetical protein
MLSLRDRRSRSKQSRHYEPPQAAKQSPRRRAGMRGHCETGAAGRSNLVTARPAQPVEAISSLRAAAGGEAIPSQTCRDARSLRDRHSWSKPSPRPSSPRGSEAGGEVRAPVPRSHGGHAAARAGGFDPPGPPRESPFMLSLRDRRSRSKQSPRRRAGVRRHCETGAAGRSHLVTAPPAQPVEAIPSPPAPLPHAGEGSSPTGASVIPRDPR